MQLNEAQQRAVESRAALKVVIAGPGSGKTRTMVEAVTRIPEDSRVAIMTFTNAGANEFRQRIQAFATEVFSGPGFEFAFNIVHCGTLHGYCFKLIQRFGGFLGYIPGKVGILPEAERIPRLLACRDKLGLKISQKLLLAALASRREDNSVVQAANLIWREYEFLLKRNNLVDYDGILRVALELLQTQNPYAHFCEAVKLDYLFVDEFQDSAQIDQQIYEAIPAANKMYVGDGDQSIFAFRGANPMGFVHLANSVFDNSITDAEGFKLELNYRSDMDICTVANTLIRHNRERVEKEIVPVSIESIEQGQVEVDGYEDVMQELAAIGGCISQTLATKQSVAVLYRMNHDVKMCRDYLQAMGLPVQVPKFEQRPPDWERAMLLLALLATPENEILAERYLKLDNDPAIVDRWMVEARAGVKDFASHLTLWPCGPPTYTAPIQRYLAENRVSEGTIRLIQARKELLGPDADLGDLLHDLHSNEETKASNEAGSIWQCPMCGTKRTERKDVYANVFCNSCGTEMGHIGEESAGIYVGTIHSAKGREWDVVFLPAFEQGILPHVSKRDDPNDRWKGISAVEAMEIEEERRLAFVAVTRAKHELYISHCAHRKGPWGPVGLGQPSQFIREMGLL